MKKKFFAVALATTMALSSTVFAATADVNIGGAFSANTGDEVLKGNFDVTYTFNNKSVGTNNWDNFVLEIFDGAGQYITLRADAFGWTAGSWTLGGDAFTLDDGTVHPTFTGAAADWAAWMTDMKAGCDVTVNIKRDGNVFNVTYTYANTAKDVMKTTVTVKESVSETVNVHLTGEKVNLTNVKFTNNANTGNSNEATKAPEATTKTPETTTVQETTTAKPAESVDVEVTGTDVVKATVGGKEVDLNLTYGKVTDAEKTRVADLIKAKFTGKVDKFFVFDIAAAADGVKVEKLDAAVKVTYDLKGTGFESKENLTVYRAETDNTLTEMKNVTVADGKISFETDHFSTYVIAQKVVKTETETTTKKEDGKGGSTGSGDAAPIVVFVAVAVAAAGVVASRKKLV